MCLTSQTLSKAFLWFMAAFRREAEVPVTAGELPCAQRGGANTRVRARGRRHGAGLTRERQGLFPRVTCLWARREFASQQRFQSKHVVDRRGHLPTVKTLRASSVQCELLTPFMRNMSQLLWEPEGGQVPSQQRATGGLNTNCKCPRRPRRPLRASRANI